MAFFTHVDANTRRFFPLPKITYSPLTFWWFKNAAFGACVPAGVGSNLSQQSELPLISALRHRHLCCSDRNTKICAQHWRYHTSQTDWANTIEYTPWVFFNPGFSLSTLRHDPGRSVKLGKIFQHKCGNWFWNKTFGGEFFFHYMLTASNWLLPQHKRTDYDYITLMLSVVI